MERDAGNLSARWILLLMTLDEEERNPEAREEERSREVAVGLKSRNSYIGYIAWAEIYLRTEGKRATGVKVL